MQFKIKWNDKKLNSLYDKLNTISNNVSNEAKKGLEGTLTDIQQMAYEYKKSAKKGILIEITDNHGILKGRVYTDKDIMPWAMFLEFGTGVYAELPHIGKTKTFYESGFQYWYLPVEKAQRDFGDERKVVFYDKEYYVMYAQEPNPFMRTAGFKGKDLALQKMNETLCKFLKEVTK